MKLWVRENHAGQRMRPKKNKVPDQLEPLMDLCRKGKLFAVQEWIASGKPIDAPPFPERFTSPLIVAVDKGFHSLAEILARAANQHNKDNALNLAVFKGKMELVELLLDYGADARCLSTGDVLTGTGPQMTALLLERGADLTTGRPFEVALKRPRAWTLSFYKRELGRHPELREQGNGALLHYAREGNVQWVRSLLNLGADPRATVRWHLNKRHSYDSTAIEESITRQHLEVLQLFAPNAREDDLNALAHSAAFFGTAPILRYLFDLGADPNSRQGDRSIFLEIFDSYRLRCVWDSRDRQLALIQLMMDVGARLDPSEPRTIKAARLLVNEMQTGLLATMLEGLEKRCGCPETVLINLLDNRARNRLKRWRLKGEAGPSRLYETRPREACVGTPQACETNSPRVTIAERIKQTRWRGL